MIIIINKYLHIETTKPVVPLVVWCFSKARLSFSFALTLSIFAGRPSTTKTLYSNPRKIVTIVIA